MATCRPIPPALVPSTNATRDHGSSIPRFPSGVDTRRSRPSNTRASGPSIMRPRPRTRTAPATAAPAPTTTHGRTEHAEDDPLPARQPATPPARAAAPARGTPRTPRSPPCPEHRGQAAARHPRSCRSCCRAPVAPPLPRTVGRSSEKIVWATMTHQPADDHAAAAALARPSAYRTRLRCAVSPYPIRPGANSAMARANSGLRTSVRASEEHGRDRVRRPQRALRRPDPTSAG